MQHKPSAWCAGSWAVSLGQKRPAAALAGLWVQEDTGPSGKTSWVGWTGQQARGLRQGQRKGRERRRPPSASHRSSGLCLCLRTFISGLPAQTLGSSHRLQGTPGEVPGPRFDRILRLCRVQRTVLRCLPTWLCGKPLQACLVNHRPIIIIVIVNLASSEL